MKNISRRSIALSGMIVAATALCGCQFYPAAKVSNTVSGPVVDTPDEVAGNYELPQGSFTEQNSNTYFKYGVWEAQYVSYLKRLPGSNQAIEKCRRQNDCNPRVALRNEFVDWLRTSGLDDKAKMELSSAIVDEMMSFNPNKNYEISTSGVNWHQTPFTSLVKGTVQCDDAAHLKRDIMKDGGIQDEKMRVTTGFIYPNDDPSAPVAHLELLVNANGRNYMLDNTLTSSGYFKPLENGGTEPASVYLQGAVAGSSYTNQHFVPLVAETASGEMKYYKVVAGNKGYFQFPSIKSSSLPSAREARICAADSCIGIDPKYANPPTVEKIHYFINQAHNLNPVRMTARTPLGQATALLSAAH